MSPPCLDRTALVVDDDPPARELAADLLKRAGFAAVDGATDGADALRRVAEHPYALLVCDLRMPGMDGIELLRHLGDGGFDRPIVLTSAASERLLASVTGIGRSHGLNVVGSLSKPLSRASLHRLLVAAGLVAPPPPDAGLCAPGAEALRDALDADAIDAWFQPTFRIADNALVGAESVARWVHPGHGDVPAEAFVPLADRVGLGGRLTARMLDRSLAFVRGLRVPPGFCVSVDLADADLRDFGTVDRLREAVAAVDVAPSSIVLGVAESRLVAEADTAAEVLTRLRMRGFGLALDGFGTGWSSLALLAQIPFTELRIDARFVLAAPTDDTALGIVESSVHLARRLGLSITADGIENPAQWEVCSRFGVDAAQGFLLGRPEPVPRFVERYLPA